MSIFPTGTENLNKWFQSGDQAYIIVASAMVLVMVPGLGFLYSGLARRKSALSMIWACMASMSVITFQWYFWGYSLAFSPTATNGFIGNLRNFGLMKTLADPSPGSPLIPGLLFAFYEVNRPESGLTCYRGVLFTDIMSSSSDAILCRHCCDRHGRRR